MSRSLTSLCVSDSDGSAFNQICTTDIKTFKSLKGGETLTFDSHCPSPWQKEMEDASIW